MQKQELNKFGELVKETRGILASAKKKNAKFAYSVALLKIAKFEEDMARRGINNFDLTKVLREILKRDFFFLMN